MLPNLFLPLPYICSRAAQRPGHHFACPPDKSIERVHGIAATCALSPNAMTFSTLLNVLNNMQPRDTRLTSSYSSALKTNVNAS